MKTKITKRLISCILCSIMIAALLPANAFAKDAEGDLIIAEDGIAAEEVIAGEDPEIPETESTPETETEYEPESDSAAEPITEPETNPEPDPKPEINKSEIVEPEIAMTEGDVIKDYVAAGTPCESTDPAVAWVDDAGSLNALRPGTATISVNWASGATGQTQVTVSDYSDGSEIVGNLKILARYNDSMDFYDGHTYLLFTSYQDQVEITVPDLYGGYEISDQYYRDIKENIANGSNHTGSDTDKYFTFRNDMTTTTLDRGQIVTIGMYRDFDLTVPQAALKSLQNSTIWTTIVNAGKGTVVETIFKILDGGGMKGETALSKLKAVFDEVGLDYHAWINGDVEGGVCFNRELYNQKLEWDQYENVTYELDITQNQLETLAASLSGNLNKFSILTNSCATVAFRAWNAAVGIRNGVDTAYKLDAAGEGVYSIMDAPKGARDEIVERLPGYYLNNAEGVAEPDAGYQDETGWVYISAPEKVDTTYLYPENTPLMIDESRSQMNSLLITAKNGARIPYQTREQEIGVAVSTEEDPKQPNALRINSIAFSINGTDYSLGEGSRLADGIWLKAPVEDPERAEQCYVTDADGKALPSEYADGWISFYLASLPASVVIVANPGEETGIAKHVLKTTVINGEITGAETTVYVKEETGIRVLDEIDEAEVGSKIFVSCRIPQEQMDYMLNDISLNGGSIMDAEHYDAEEGAYYFSMPAKHSALKILYEEAYIYNMEWEFLQMFVGEELDVTDCALLLAGEDWETSYKLKWEIIHTYDAHDLPNDGENGVLIPKNGSDQVLVANRPGTTYLWAYAEGNENIGLMYTVDVSANTDDMVQITYPYDNADNISILAQTEDNPFTTEILHSGFWIKKGSVIKIIPVQDENEAVSNIFINGATLPAGQTFTAEKDTNIHVLFKKAVVKGMPRTASLSEKGDTYQLNAKVRYTGLSTLLPVYDPSIRYESGDLLVSVDETGLLTLVGEVPEDGKAVIITAYAGSSNDKVFAQCKVCIGDYQGEKIVGRVTISARSTSSDQLIPHCTFTFTTYEDLDLAVSYYHYFEPNEKYHSLMEDYADHPENYSSDPALYNDDELGIGDTAMRETYFNDLFSTGAYSAPQSISLKSGESMSMTNYGYGHGNINNILYALTNSTLAKESRNAQQLIIMLQQFKAGEEIDKTAFYDSFVSTFEEMYEYVRRTGINPIDNVYDGGLDINKEMYNQFRRNDTQFPNNYYTIEITADELACLLNYLSNPDNNYYSMFNMNCGTGAVDLWNTTLADRPELMLTGNYSLLATEPQSLYFELGLMRLKPGLGGKGGTNFYPRTVASRHQWEVTKTSKNTLAAKCINAKTEHHYGECKYLDNGCPLTLSVSKTTECSYDSIKLTGLKDFNAITGKTVAANADYIKFYKVDQAGATTGGKAVPAGTAQKGYYYAKLTVDDVTIRAPFVIHLTRPDAPTVTSPKTAALKASWTKTAKITGYQLQYSLKSDFSTKKTIIIKDANTLSQTLTGLKSGKKYYLRLRLYKKSADKTYYSAWSKTKSKTVK